MLANKLLQGRANGRVGQIYVTQALFNNRAVLSQLITLFEKLPLLIPFLDLLSGHAV
jgi:hypothetical protein